VYRELMLMDSKDNLSTETYSLMQSRAQPGERLRRLKPPP